MARIVLIEDDVHLARGLVYNLEKAGYEVTVAQDGVAGLASVQECAPDLVVLDLMLPLKDGYQVLSDLRAGGHRMPVIILSARTEEVDKIRGLDTGADDYVTKPFGVGELLARIRTRLTAAAPGIPYVSLGTGRLDLEKRTFERDGQVAALTPTEVEILRVLTSRPDAPVDRDDLMRAVWGIGPTTSRTLGTHITRLRRKIEVDPHHPRHLLTVHGVGYRLAP